MKNSTRSVNFTIAFFGALSGFYFIIARFPIENYFSNPEIALIAAAMSAIGILFPLIQALLRYFQIKKFYVPERLFFKANLGERFVQQRALYYVIVLLSHFFIYLKPGLPIPTEAYIWAAIWLLVFELTMAVTYTTTKVFVMGDGIIIKGFDLRMDIPLSDPLISHSGVYSYDDFDSYEMKGNRFTLHMPGKIGRIQLMIPEDKVPHISSFLNAKGLELIRKNK